VRAGPGGSGLGKLLGQPLGVGDTRCAVVMVTGVGVYGRRLQQLAWLAGLHPCHQGPAPRLRCPFQSNIANAWCADLRFEG